MLLVDEEKNANSAVLAPKRPLAVMDLRAVLNDVDEDVFPESSAIHKKSYPGAGPLIKPDPDVETDKDNFIDRTTLIKHLRRDLKEDRARIAKITEELFILKEIHGEILEKHENVGDEMRVQLRNKAALETRTKQIEKRADRVAAEEVKLIEQFEKLSIRHKTAELAISAMEAGRKDEVADETRRQRDIIVTLQDEGKALNAEVEERTQAAERMRLDYQQESNHAAEVCREVEGAKEETVELKKRGDGEALRLRSEFMDIELSLGDDRIRQLSLEVENLEDHLRRLDIEQQRRMAKYTSRPTTSFAKRTRSPATSSLSRGCSPATLSGTVSTNNSHSNGSGHRLQYSQKV
ncbi:hypothetical protein POJ06DRAFT_272623 [Lipomyces tetrasporus]|uniref:Uncharacterized protein n=1 Tax=Lipomyces tetrasporus TaxID=54092 RepID=A0AAD7VWH1_9ASCO|nr:uncharacterized protein POJ06DRAFT_272623 [Lipomyces tetrasporus]KAJ8103974.1 hypothetical protein POJ06DRAFT_272623 [Lipomyces tetrasporus]